MALESSLLFCRKFSHEFLLDLLADLPSSLRLLLHGIHGRVRRVERLPDAATFNGPEELEPLSMALHRPTSGASSTSKRAFCRGPFYHEDEVSEVVGSRHWIAMPRFPVPQATMVRAVDDGSPSGSSASAFSCMTEKLSVPSIDQIIEVSRTLRNASSGPLAGWVVDEASAFRQIAVSPCSRRVALAEWVTTLWTVTLLASQRRCKISTGALWRSLLSWCGTSDLLRSATTMTDLA